MIFGRIIEFHLDKRLPRQNGAQLRAKFVEYLYKRLHVFIHVLDDAFPARAGRSTPHLRLVASGQREDDRRWETERSLPDLALDEDAVCPAYSPSEVASVRTASPMYLCFSSRRSISRRIVASSACV